MPARSDVSALSRSERPYRTLAASMAEDIILETRGLRKEFKGFVAVSDVSLKVRRGRIHALIGPNGAGKTTCFNLLTHFLSPTRGQIFYNGRQITGSSPAAIARLGLVRSFQISAVFPHLTVLENVRMALADVERIAALIRRVAAHRTVLMVEHNLGVVENLSDHITVLSRGETIAEGDYRSVSAHPEVIKAYLGSEHA